jgi:hypothetical protein
VMGTVGLVFMPGLDHRRAGFLSFPGEKRKAGGGDRYSYSKVSTVRTLGSRHTVGIERQGKLEICCG